MVKMKKNMLSLREEKMFIKILENIKILEEINIRIMIGIEKEDIKEKKGIIEKAAETILLGWANRLLGVLVYAFIYLSFLSIILLYLRQFGIIEVDSASKTQEYLLKLGNWTTTQYGKWLPDIKNLFSNSADFIKDKSDKML